MKIKHLAVLIGFFSLQFAVRAQVIFTDNFNALASPQWGNERGNWSASGGVYNAQFPNNSPLTYSSLPYALNNFAVDVDINDVGDGGIWLRSDASGQNGILLVTGGWGWGAGISSAGRSLYWHVVSGGNTSPVLNSVDVFTNPGVEDVHLRVTAIGNTYAVYLNGSAIPATTLVDSTFTSGRVGLYDFSSQTFDNFTLSAVPEPSVLSLAVLGAAIANRRRPGR